MLYINLYVTFCFFLSYYDYFNYLLFDYLICLTVQPSLLFSTLHCFVRTYVRSYTKKTKKESLYGIWGCAIFYIRKMCARIMTAYAQRPISIEFSSLSSVQ